MQIRNRDCRDDGASLGNPLPVTSVRFLSGPGFFAFCCCCFFILFFIVVLFDDRALLCLASLFIVGIVMSIVGL